MLDLCQGDVRWSVGESKQQRGVLHFCKRGTRTMTMYGKGMHRTKPPTGEITTTRMSVAPKLFRDAGCMPANGIPTPPKDQIYISSYPDIVTKCPSLRYAPPKGGVCAEDAPWCQKRAISLAVGKRSTSACVAARGGGGVEFTYGIMAYVMRMLSRKGSAVGLEGATHRIGGARCRRSSECHCAVLVL